MILTNSELKKLKRMQKVEKTFSWMYVFLGISILTGIVAIIGKNLIFAMLCLITLFLFIGVKEQLKLFRIIKKLQGELKQNPQERHSSETR